MFGAAAPAGAATESFALTSSSLPGQSSVTWQGPPLTGTPNVFPSTVSLSGQIDQATGNISGATLTLPPLPQPEQQGENTTFAFSDSGNATGNFNATTGAVTLNDTLTLTFTGTGLAAITCVSTPIDVALAGTWDSTTQNVTLAASGFTIPQFPPTSGSNCGLAADSLNVSPGGVAGSVGNAMSLALNGQFAPGLPTTTSLSVSPDSPQTAGTKVTLSGSVTDPSGQGTPTGTVTFLDNGVSIGTGTLSSGTATLSTTTLPGGTNQLSASYGGDSSYASSVSTAQSYAIQPKPTVAASLPSQVTVGGGTAPITLNLANPPGGNDWSAMYLQIALSGPNQSANTPTLSYKDSAGNICPFTYATFTTAYYSGTGPAPCGTPPASFSLNAGASLTVPLYISYPSSAVPGTQTVTATLFTGSCTSATSCTATAPLSGSAAPKSSSSFPIAPAARVASPSMTASVYSPSDGSVPQGFEVQALAFLTVPTTPSGMPTPTGTVTCAIDGGSTTATQAVTLRIVSGVLGGGAVCTFVTTPTDLVPGTHTITASYSGDSTYLPDSASTTFTVTPAPPGVPFACSYNFVGVATSPFAATLQVQTDTVPADVPPNSTFTMTGIDVTMHADADISVPFPLSVSATLADGQTITGPDQEMSFTQDGDVYTGTISGLTANIATGAPGSTVTPAITGLQLSISLDGISIVYTCDQDSLPLPSVTASGTTLTVSPDSPANVGAPVTMTATVYPPPTSSTGGGQVDFYDGATDLATVPVSTSNGAATFTTATLSPGDHQLTAVWSGNLQVPTNTSNEVDYQVGSPSTTTLSSSANPANAANPVTFTATVTGASGGPQPTGDVAFSEDGTPISSCASQALSTANPPTATCTVSLGAGETHAIVATYSGDGNSIGSASDPLSQVTLPGTTSTLTTKANPAPAGPVTFWDGVAATGGGSIPAGTVAFTVDGKVYPPCGAVALGPGGGAQCTVSFKAGTTHSVFATYAGSTSYSGSKSNTVSLKVNGGSSATGPKTTGGSATLASGKSLTAGQSLTAGSYRLVMQSDGNLVEYQGSKALWASGTSGHLGAGVTMQKDGNLVEYNHGHAIWASKTAGHPGAHLTLQGTDGNVVIYTPAGHAVWATGT